MYQSITARNTVVGLHPRSLQQILAAVLTYVKVAYSAQLQTDPATTPTIWYGVG